MNQLLFQRKNLNRAFEKIMSFPLTIAVAPMGYGKTTAARTYLEENKIPCVWLSIERDEDSAEYIWSILTRQLSKVMPELGNQLRVLGFPDDFSKRDKVLELIEEYTFRTNSVLIIDDYHFAHSSEVDAFLDFIVWNAIEGFHILLLSRTMPTLSVDEMGLKGVCHLIKNSLFELSLEEIKLFFELYDCKIDVDIAREAYAVSEGWISAVYLIVQRFIEIGKIEHAKSIERLIEKAVVKWYSDREIDLLTKLSILESFTPEQVAFITGDRSNEKILYKLSESNSLIYFDKVNQTYKLHNILNSYFKSFFVERLQASEKNELLKKSGTWYIQHDDVILGIKYFLEAKAYKHILEAFEGLNLTEIIDCNPKYILKCFEEIPELIKYQYPIAFLTFAGFYVTNIDPVKGLQLIDAFESYFYSYESGDSEIQRIVKGEIELIRGYSEFNDVEKMQKRFKRAHELLEGNSLIANKEKIITFGSAHILYLYYKTKGTMYSILDEMERLFWYYNDLSNGCGMGFEHQFRAEYCLETGDLEAAENKAQKAIIKAETLNQISVIICSKLVLARILVYKGKSHDAIEIMDNLGQTVDALNSPILSSAFDVSLGYLGGLLNEEQYFATWLKKGLIRQSDVLYQGKGLNYIVYGKYLLIKKAYLRLEILCEEMIKVFEIFDNQFGYLHLFLLEAIAKYKLYGFEKSKRSLIKALEIAREDHIILPLVEYGKDLLRIILELRACNLKDPYLDEVIERFQEHEVNLRNDSGYINTMQSTLTEREMEILSGIVEGKTNREISEKLFIAEVTVRKNITSIYRKLEVKGRALAVKKAIDLNLL
ncbi:LuxR C-terminal-related transcriptional regulator [Fusibacter ferrireducens]|uniref:HTH luxR-type domain-containing protein n=1 Tax=Fusibacter ferrireducens TaxID=2785058 RepID=A0ABR9ZYB6_9FIRM|nr:LuxR C-terminal-related transcriptional regulator [Fusibacter ferrireducens]MBF4695458.1 hypothetical protein [Fusibacter ferrireducens]